VKEILLGNQLPRRVSLPPARRDTRMRKIHLGEFPLFGGKLVHCVLGQLAHLEFSESPYDVCDVIAILDRPDRFVRRHASQIRSVRFCYGFGYRSIAYGSEYLTTRRPSLEPAGKHIRRVEVSQFTDVRQKREIAGESYRRIGLPLDLSELVLGHRAGHLRREPEQILDGPIDSAGSVELAEERLLERAQAHRVAELGNVPPSFIFEALDGRVEQLDRIFH